MTSDIDPVDRSLVAAASSASGPCPDPDRLAGFSEGRLEDREGEALAAHASGCAACRAVLTAMAEAGPDANESHADARANAAPRIAWFSPVLAAAALLVALGAAAFWFARSRAPGTADGDVDARLVASARELAAADPGLFGDFAPLSAADRGAVGDGRLRGGLTLLHPVEVVLSQRPELRWVEVPGATSYEIALSPEGGPASWTRTARGGRLAYPGDAPALERGGRYAWTVATEAVLGGRTEGRRTFSVASAEEADAFDRARRRIAERAPDDLRSLLLAHWAFRAGLLEEAERLAREHVARHPDEPVGVQTLSAIRRRLGAPEPADGGAPR